MLLSAQADELERIVANILLKNPIHASDEEGDEGTRMRMRMPRPAAMVLCPIVAAKSRLLVGQYASLDSSTEIRMPDACTAIIVIHNAVSQPSATDPNPSTVNPSVLHLSLPAGKRGSTQFLESVLPRAVAFAQGKLEEEGVLGVVCNDGKDISVGVGIAILQALFDDQGEYTGTQDTNGELCFGAQQRGDD